MEGLLMLFSAARHLSASEYAFLLLVLLCLFLYHALELHFFEDLLRAFRGHRVQILCNSASPLASEVLPRCEVLKRRYQPTPWLCSPHIQTAFLHFFGRPPQFEYKRQLCRTPDGGTIALDCLYPKEDPKNSSNAGSCRTVVLIPGLTSDSQGTYMKHISYSLVVAGWRVVVANHRGLGGVSITSNQFYNAGWTEDLRTIINRLHQEDPTALLFAVGTSIGANILVKYLGEEGDNTPLGGAAAICCPWDLLVCDRFICRKMIQRFYDKILAFGLRTYAALHQVALSKLADWDLISKSRTVRDFDNYCTCIVGRFETVDTYYRKSSSAYYLQSVAIPLFCISALDDPVCTKEAIPWDECRVNANVVLCVTRHGGHLAFFEGLTARSMWWVRVTTEFLEILHASSFVHVTKPAPTLPPGISPLLHNVVDKSPYLSSPQDGIVASEMVPQKDGGRLGELYPDDTPEEELLQAEMKPSRNVSVDTLHAERSRQKFNISQNDAKADNLQGMVAMVTQEMGGSKASSSACSDAGADCFNPTFQPSVQSYSQLLSMESTLFQLLEQVETMKRGCRNMDNGQAIITAAQSILGSDIVPEKQRFSAKDIDGSLRSNSLVPFYQSSSSFDHVQGTKSLAGQNQRALWLLAYIAVVTTWPLVGSALFIQGKSRLKNLFGRFVTK